METTQQPSPVPFALRYGLYAGLVLTIIGAILNITELSFNQTIGYLSTLLFWGAPIVAIILALKDFRQNNGGYLSLGQSIGLGTLLCVVMGFISGLFTTLYVKVIDASFAEKVIDNARRQMEEKGTMSDEQVDKAIEISRPFTEAMFTYSFIISPILYAIIGVIFSLIIGAIMKKDRDVFLQ
ncbi:DUF4199 domain-containing protein [Cytophagaceae bacterium DM2B3-1]|uniref:DUF4199 domain-containing protein n=1 Tax=Xanthocytophaga flava TaxID=3048013 RepID=A0ABT7CES0_9BACT|nr:DUF4199 domain-containing protein [Xanthocytophaga flavus]MDJ1468958.1 DUF4199 domain-containing protein [Xanthocytophaga flavus]MDJ1492132.1 DUF4199 domain-containing protein [Xanthocytophaga flavus]